jgi:hypothetical protein
MKWLPTRIQITEMIGEVNQVRAELEYKYTPGTDLTETEQSFVNNYQVMGRDLDLSSQPWSIPGLGEPPFPQYDPNLSWMPGPYGYNTWGGERDPAAVALFQCYLQRPYHPWHATGWWPAPQNPPDEVLRPAVEEVSVQRVEPGALTVPEEERKYSESHTRAMYTFCRMHSVYRLSQSKKQYELLGTSKNGATAAIVSTGSGKARRIIVVDAERNGKPPELPPPKDYEDANGVKGTLASFKVECLPPVVSPAGDSWIFRLRARYVYLLDRLPPTETVAAPWPVGRLPHTADTSLGWNPLDSWSDRLGPDQRPLEETGGGS